MAVHRIRAIAVALSATALGTSSFVLNGCGNGADSPGEAAGSAQAAAGGASAKIAETKKQPEPKTLGLLEGSHPTVAVRPKETIGLYEEPEGRVVKRVDQVTEFGSRTVFAVTAKDGEWASVLTPHAANGKPLWLKLDPAALKAGGSIWNIEVDLSAFETRLYVDGELVKSFQVSVGTPTAPTPTGRFAITDTFRGNLNPAYGCCALATTARQINLPSGWLGGNRIAFHGTTGPLGAENSSGCIRAANADVSDLVDMVPPGTPVEIHQ